MKIPKNVEVHVRNIFPGAQFREGEDGELIIYTGKSVSAGKLQDWYFVKWFDPVDPLGKGE